MKKLVLFFTALFVAAFAFSEAKNALLIANAAYPNAPLGTPLQEARGLKQTLERLNFNVTLVENADIGAMEKAVSDFGYLLKSRGGIAFFHYGGHAVQIAGKNYLIPARTDISNESQIKRLSLDLDDLMENMQGDTNIVILDSCRDNPFFGATRGASRGLALSHVKPKNSIIVYSAEAGNKAQDGVFTPILTKKLLEKKSLHSILLDVRREVNKATGGQQLPKNDDGLLDDVYLAGYSNAASSSVPEPEPEPAPTYKPEPENPDEDVAILAALNTGDLSFASKEVFRLAQTKAGTGFPLLGGTQWKDGAMVWGSNYVSSSGKVAFAINLGEHVMGVIRYTGPRNGKVGFFIGQNGSVKNKALLEKLQAAASEKGWEIKTVKSSSSAKEEAEFILGSEAFFMSQLSDYHKVAADLAEILKAAK